MIALALIIGALVFATMLLPQGLFGMLCAYRARDPRKPFHTDETGMPTLI